MKKFMIYSVVALLIFSYTGPHYVEAQTTDALPNTGIIESEYNENIEENIQYKEDIIDDEATITTTIATEELSASSELVIDLNSSEMIIDNVLEDEQGNIITNQFIVHMLHIDGEDFKAILVDQATGEEVYVDTEEVHASIAPLVIVLATIARYGIARAIAKHGATQVAKATVSNAAKTKLTTDSAAKALATELGYSSTNYLSSGARVFSRTAKDAVSGPKYITRDVTSHIGGVWKGATSVDNLRSKATRSGTYDAILKRIGD